MKYKTIIIVSIFVLLIYAISRLPVVVLTVIAGLVVGIATAIPVSIALVITSYYNHRPTINNYYMPTYYLSPPTDSSMLLPPNMVPYHVIGDEK